MTQFRLGALALAIACSPLAAQWGQQSPTTSPQARSGHGMCLTGTQIVLHGGSAGFSTSSETWVYDGTNWDGTAITGGPVATGIRLVDMNGIVVLYGGMSTSPFGGPSIDQTYTLTGTTWAAATPTVTPGGLGNYGACYHPGRSAMVLYGGAASSSFPIAESGTWEFDGTNWAQVSVTSAAGPLERPAMCYHAGSGMAVMFGGIDPQIGGVDTTWLYDSTGTWTAATVTGIKPPVRTGARLAYDSVRDVCVLNGGLNPSNGQPIIDTWELSYDSNTITWAWTQVPTSTNGHFASALAFLPSIRQVVEFGGLDPTTFADYGDTWHYGAKSNAFGTGCSGTFGMPTLTASDAPRLGQSFTMTLTNLDPAAGIAVMVIGLSDQISTLGPLPYDLGSYGMPGCFLLASNEATTFVGAAAGSASLTTALPANVMFLGLPLFHQGMSLDAAANITGLTVSNAISGIVGN